MTLIPTQEQISKMHCGVMGASFSDVYLWMRQIFPILVESPVKYQFRDYVVDAKVHMLMPNQYPCIPNWHYDHIPRDSQGVKQWHQRDESQDMYLWLSGPPFTEFRDGREVRVGEWLKFNQFDEHRGTMSDRHQWRLFIRLTPREIHPKINESSACIRRHSQVYLDANGFEW